MNDTDKTREQLVAELGALRQRVAELEGLETRHKAVERELLHAEARWRRLLESLPMAIAEVDFDGTILALTKPRPGFSLEDSIGKSIFEISTPEDSDFTKSLMAEVRETKAPVEFEMSGSQPDGGIAWGLHQVAPVVEEGEIKSFIITSQDITERKATEEALRESEAMARVLLEAPADSIFLLDAAYNILDCNETATRKLDRSAQELVGQCLLDLFPPTVAVFRKKHFDEALETGQPVRFEDERAGMWFDTVVHPIHDSQGEVTRLALFAHDITDRKHAEIALRESEEKYSALLEDIQEGFFEVDLAGNFTFFNEALSKLTGYPQSELMGMNNQRFTDAETAKVVYQSFNAIYRTGIPDRGHTWELIRKDGARRTVETSASLITDPSGQPTGFRGLARDITDRKQAAETLRVQRDLAVALSSTSDLTDCLDRLLDITFQIEGIDAGGVYLVDEPTGALNLVCHRGLPDAFVVSAAHFSPAAPQTQLVLAGKPVYQPYSQLFPDDTSEIRIREGLRALAVVPVHYEGRVIAAINLASHTRDEFPVGSQTVLETIAAQVGGVIARIRAEAALREGRQNLQTLFDTIDDLLFILDEHGAILETNRAVQQRLGYSAGELAGQPLLKVHPPGRHEEAQVLLADMLAGKVSTCSLPVLTKAGGIIPVETKVTHGQWGDQKVLFGLTRDISARLRADEALRASEARYRAVVEDQLDFIVRWKPDGTRLFVNDAYCRFFNMSREEMLAERGIALLQPEVRQLVLDKIGQLTPAAPVISYTHEITKPAGHVCWLEWFDRALFDDAGQLIELQSVGRDITDRKHAEKLQAVLLQIAQAANRPGSLKDVVQAIHHQIGTLVDTTNFYVALYDPEEDRYSFPYWVDKRDTNFYPQQMAGSFTDYVRRTGKPILIDEVVFQQLAEAGDVRQVGPVAAVWLGAPLRTSKGVIGVVAVQSYQARSLYSAQDLELLTVVSEHIASIIERKRAEEALRASEERYRVISEVISDYAYVFRIEPDGTYAQDWITADAYTRITGYAPEELGNTFNLYHPEERETARQDVEKVIAGQPSGGEYRIRTKSGELRWLQIQRQPVWDDDHTRVIRFYGAASDITERKLAEEALRQSEERYRTLFENVPIGISLSVLRGEVLMINNAMKRIFGYSREDLDQMNGYTFYQNREDRDRMLEGLKKDGYVRDFEIAMRRKDGSPYYASMTIVPAPFAGENVVMTMNVDITERKQAEETLRLSDAVLRQMPDAILVTDLAGNIRRWMGNAEQIFGYTAEEAIGQPFSFLHRPDIRQMVSPRIIAAIQQTGEFFGEIPCLRKDGAEVPIETTASAVYDSEGNPIALVSMNKNIAERKQAEEQALELAVGKEKVRILSQFIQDASHEFKTPLSMINLHTHVIKRATESEAIHGRIRQVETQVQTISALVDDLVVMSQLDSGGPPVVGPVEVNEVVRNVRTALDYLVDVDKLRVNLEVSTDPLVIEGSLDEIHTAVNNIMKNAIRYTPEGAVTVRTRQEGDEVVIEVQDTGVGMDDEVLSNIFDRFYRADKAHTTGGFGLGLPIALKIVERHNGLIEVESEPGKGSIFRIIWPIKATVAR